MLDLIKEGIKLNLALALLPLRVIRRLIDDKNTGAKQAVDVAEDMVSAPFVAATKAIDNSCKPSEAGTDKNSQTSNIGLKIGNVWVNPEFTVFSDVETGEGKRKAILTVTGLLCGG